MSFLAAILVLNIPDALDAFKCFVNVLENQDFAFMFALDMEKVTYRENLLNPLLKTFLVFSPDEYAFSRLPSYVRKTAPRFGFSFAISGLTLLSLFAIVTFPFQHQHFGELGIRPDMYLYEWLFTIFSRCVGCLSHLYFG